MDGERERQALTPLASLSLPLPPLSVTPSVAPLMLIISFSRVRRWASNWAAWRERGRKKE